MESRLKASTDPHGRWDMAVQDRPPPSLPPHVLPGYRNMLRPAPRTCAVGIHPTVAKFESQRPGSRRDGWDASRGTVRSTGFIPGPNGYLGVTIWPWVSPMPTWPVANPQNQAFLQEKEGPLRGGDGNRYGQPGSCRTLTAHTSPAPRKRQQHNNKHNRSRGLKLAGT